MIRLKTTDKELNDFIGKEIEMFHNNRIDKIKSIQLKTILQKKNPYLFKAKGLESVEGFIKAILDAFISSSEETMFGDLMEHLAFFICKKEKGGFKSSCEGIDLEFEEDDIRYLISIKSGPNWCNSSQQKKMIQEFKTAQKTLRTSNFKINTRCVNGCCYGKDDNPDKGDYLKYCGERFWEFISGEKDFHKKILKPIEIQAKDKNDEFLENYQKVVNKYVKEFLNEYCNDDGSINWEKIVEVNSGKKEKNI